MAAIRTRTFQLTKDNTSRRRVAGSGGDDYSGSGEENHWLVGRIKDTTPNPDRTHEYWVTAQADLDWDGVGRVITAELVLTATSSTGNPHVTMGNTGRCTIQPVSEGVKSWSEGNRGEDSWGNDNYQNPKLTGATGYRVKSGQMTPGTENRIDIMPVLRFWGPTSRKFRINGVYQSGRGSTNRGFRVWEETDKSSAAMVFWSRERTVTEDRPHIVITYEPGSTEPTATKIAPNGDVTDGPTFILGMLDEDPDQKLATYRIQVRRTSDQVETWDTGVKTATDAEREARQTDLVAPLAKWPIGKEQEWRGLVTDNETPGNESDWTSWGSTFTVTGGVPTLGTPKAIGSVSKLAGSLFVAQWSHPQGKAIASLRIQARPSTPIGDPSWEGADNVWDTGDVTPTAGELKGNLPSTPPGFARAYGGDSLRAGSYSWRARITDELGVNSVWVYSTFTLTSDYDVVEPDDDNAGFGRRVLGTRIILRAMGTNRGPGALRAVIEDAENIGASAYASAPGELYFTLPATHPQVGECEPYKTHYALETYRNGQWQEVFAGIITDFDATGDDVVINGMDYLGLLSLDVERRSWITGSSKKDPKYVEKTIRYIIRDQLEAARDTSNSTVKFIEVPSDGPLFQAMGTTIHIDGSYRQRLEFIRGLIDSQRAGTGLRSRLIVRRKPGSTADETHGYTYQYNLLTDSGRDRPAIRMEWGGLIQGFRIQAFGDFTVKVLGIGRESGELKPHYKEASIPKPVGAPDPASVWGNLAKVAVWQDIEDENDLARRALQLAAESGRIGKRMALGLRVHGLGPFDGWDITDSIPIDIVRGVVDTGHYAPDSDGLSWWTIWGTEWRVSPDGHDEITLVVRPREDALPPDPDLIVGKPFVPTPEWVLGAGPPPSPAPAPSARFYMNTDNGDVFVLDDTVDPAEYVLEANMEGPPGPPGPPGSGGSGDTTPPQTPTTVLPTAGALIAQDGTMVPWIDVTWVQPTDLDIDHWVVRYRIEDAPSWDQVDTAVAYVRLFPVSPGREYEITVQAVDLANLTSAESTPVTVTAVATTLAPEVPAKPDLVPGYKLMGVSWPRSPEPEVARYGVRYAAGAVAPTDPAAWTVLSTFTTSIVITGLTIPDSTVTPAEAPTLYWFQVRAIDRTNRVATAIGDRTPVSAADFPEAGWSALNSGYPGNVGVSDLAVSQLLAESLEAGTIDAALIQTGTLKVGPAGDDPRIEVYGPGSAAPVGIWMPNGLLTIDPAVPGRATLMTAGELRVTNNFSWLATTPPYTSWPVAPAANAVIWTNSITAEGINASAITFGINPGGHNNIPNAGFELRPPVGVVEVIWDTAGEWATATSQVNLDVSTALLKMTSVAY